MKQKKRQLRFLRSSLPHKGQIVSFYKGIALLLFNTLLLFIFVESVAAIIYIFKQEEPSYPPKLFGPSPQQKKLLLPYYKSQDWSEQYWQEWTDSKAIRYFPWVIWRRNHFEGTTIKVKRNGIRVTPGVNCSLNSYKIFAFGGSTMWWSGSPDWGTTPAYLHAELSQKTKEPLCIINFGETAFVSTQSLIQLIVELQSHHIPELVIFYDGINDVYAAYQSGKAGIHHNLEQIATTFEGAKEKKSLHPLLQWLIELKSFLLFKKFVAKFLSTKIEPGPNRITYQTKQKTAHGLAESIAQVYLHNYEIVDALSQKYGFKYSFFWQPVISIGNKSLTDDEQTMKDTMDSALIALYQETYRIIGTAAIDYKNLHYIADVLDEQKEQIWIDRHHVTPQGNMLIAKRMVREFAKNNYLNWSHGAWFCNTP